MVRFVVVGGEKGSRKEEKMINDPLWGKIKCVDAEKLEELLKEIKPGIRCKDCKYLFKVKNGVFVTYGCERDWCCYAERKEE